MWSTPLMPLHVAGGDRVQRGEVCADGRRRSKRSADRRQHQHRGSRGRRRRRRETIGARRRSRAAAWSAGEELAHRRSAPSFGSTATRAAGLGRLQRGLAPARRRPDAVLAGGRWRALAAHRACGRVADATADVEVRRGRRSASLASWRRAQHHLSRRGFCVITSVRDQRAFAAVHLEAGAGDMVVVKPSCELASDPRSRSASMHMTPSPMPARPCRPCW